jgi:hypothetical protein
MGWLSKQFIFILCLTDFGKSYWLGKGDGLWLALLITLNLSVRICFDK